MPHYMIEVAYNASGAAGMVKEPQNRVERVTPAIEKLGGRVECGYFAFGDADIVLICEMPDNATAAAFALAVGAGGSVTSYKTTVLLTPEEAVEAMRKASDTGYQPAAA
jgi:uncharacterized protein with GYD domain